MRKSTKQAVNLTLMPEIVEWLDQIVKQRHFASRSVLVEELIRDRHDQVFGVVSPEAQGKSSTSNLPPPDQSSPPQAKRKRAA